MNFNRCWPNEYIIYLLTTKGIYFTHLSTIKGCVISARPKHSATQSTRLLFTMHGDPECKGNH